MGAAKNMGIGEEMPETDDDRDIQTHSTRKSREEESRRLLKKSGIAVSVFSAVSLALMLFYLMNRSVVITDAAAEREAADVIESAFSMTPTGDAQEIDLTLPADVDSKDIVMENHYTTAQLWIYIDSKDGFYTADTSVSAPSKVQTIECVPQDTGGSVCIHFQLDSIYEYTSSLDGNTIKITLEKPSDVYDRIVVIDPAAADEGGEDSALLTALSLSSKLEEKGIKAYLFRSTSKEEMDSEDKAAFLNEVEPDLFISLAGGEKLTTYYDDELYLRGYGNEDFAAQVASDMAYACAEDKAEVSSLSEHPYELMTHLDMPAVLVAIPETADTAAGSSKDTEKVLEKEEDSIADGLCNAVQYAYKAMEE